jgi:hypothetical protein
MTPKFNEFWEQFIELERESIRSGLPPFTKQDILDKLAEARDIYTIVSP